ncbi:ABC transporter permease [Phytoactinopolyspora endophytica]|uniref:ABC transporter permease n=1 Tax=Phytoactinopolyspora endophytica TaxID=1642495 RepID=UPI00101DDCD0|nr:ABC transporter permease [Phytoactinopolyspora endophytica]
MNANTETRAPARTGWVSAAGKVNASLLSLVVAALAWEVIGRLADVPFFPPLSDVLGVLGDLITDGDIFGNLLTSLGNLALGFALSLVAGLVVGTAMGRYRRVNAALGIYVYALLTAPSLVFAPIFFSILGAGQASIVAVVFMYSAFIMIINTASAVENVSDSLIEMGRSYGAGEWQLVTRVILPAAAPMIFAGIRLGMGRAVTGMINGEMFIAVVGLGRMVTQAGKRFDGAEVLAILLVIIAVALAAIALVQFVDRKVTGWVPATSKESG